MGPCASASQRAAAAAKWRARASSIAHFGAAASVSCQLYTTKAAPALNYSKLDKTLTEWVVER